MATAGFGTPSITTWTRLRLRQRRYSSPMWQQTPSQSVWVRAASCFRIIRPSLLLNSSARLRRCIPIESISGLVVLQGQTKSPCKRFGATRVLRSISPKMFLNFRPTSATRRGYRASTQLQAAELTSRSTSSVPLFSVLSSLQCLASHSDSPRISRRINFVKQSRCIDQTSVRPSNSIIRMSLLA
ncbi:unannotated protein [freshwater metagenome]|uniref:Unannotated protein n=1 Tax=freshwater metagenome TaxID=449393 RepID=A0A6J7IZB7_9ZZZZ